MNIENKHFDIAIATPGRSMVAEYTTSLIETINYFNENNISYCFLNEACSHVAEARQRTFNSFYWKYGQNSTYKKMIWIDSDISWSVKNIIDLYETDKDIVTGAYQVFGRIAANPTSSYHYSKEDILNMQECTKILHCGMGFLSVNFGILENIEHPFLPMNYLDGKDLIKYIGEDICFCLKAQIYLNKEVWINPKIKVNHHKIQKLGW